MTSFWNFRKISPSEMNYDPVQGEFFTGSDIVDRLVRETLQNSLDVKSGEKPVRIRFAIHSAGRDFPKDRLDFYFDGLLPHLRGSGSDFDPRGQKLVYMVIEDFETTGLTGDPERTTDDRDNHFYYFFRNVGRSGKGQDKGGSWGLGKWVLPDASRLNAFFALTRRDDGRTLFMGQAVLKQHVLGGVKYDPYGFFSRVRDDGSGLQIPFDGRKDGETVENFRRDFNLRRKDEPGLSVVIPFLSETDDPIGAQDVVRAVIKHYFYPIISDNLVVEISDYGGTWNLESDNMEDVVSHLDWPPDRELNGEDLVRLIDMVRTGLEERATHWIELGHSPKRNIEEMLAGEKESLSQRLDSGERLHFVIPVAVRRKEEKQPAMSRFRAVVEKDETVEQGKDYYVRGNLAIQDIDTIKSHQARALVHVKEDEPLAHLLRDTEEPSHSNWRANSARAKEKYVNVEQTVRFVKNAVRDILVALARDKKEEVRENAFIDVFFVEKPEAPGPGGNGSEPEQTPWTAPRVEPPETDGSPFRIGKISGGFTVSASESGDLPGSVLVDLAYESRGNPLSRYSPYDFRLEESPIVVENENCSCEGAENRLAVTDVREGFSVVVSGFDPNRDLYIRAEAAETGEKEDD